MDTLVAEKRVYQEQKHCSPVHTVVEQKKKSFEEAVAECNGITVEAFIDELRNRVKERYRNAKG